MDTDILNLITNFVSSVGFPIFVAVWLLVRTDPLLRELTTTIRELIIRLGGDP